MNTYQGITLTDDQISIARARLKMRVQQAVQDMQSASYDPGTISNLIADLEALERFEVFGGAEEESSRPAKGARRGH